jgi:cation transport regulator
MANTKSKRKSPKRGKAGKKAGATRGSQLSARTEKQIDSLPQHAQHIYRKVHTSAIKQYQSPEKRRGGKSQSAEQVAHKAAWAAVKKSTRKKEISG